MRIAHPPRNGAGADANEAVAFARRSVWYAHEAYGNLSGHLLDVSIGKVSTGKVITGKLNGQPMQHSTLNHDQETSTGGARTNPPSIDGGFKRVLNNSMVMPDASSNVVVPCAFFNKNLHSRMPLDPTLARVKLFHACDQWHSFQEFIS